MHALTVYKDSFRLFCVDTLDFVQSWSIAHVNILTNSPMWLSKNQETWFSKQDMSTQHIPSQVLDKGKSVTVELPQLSPLNPCVYVHWAWVQLP